jgi:hypothetical protein
MSKESPPSNREYVIATILFGFTSVANLVLSAVALWVYERMWAVILHGIICMIAAYAAQYMYTHYEEGRDEEDNAS